MRIVIVGDLLLDLHFDGQEQQPNPEIPGSNIIRAECLRASLGGAGNVAAICAERLETVLIAPVGGWPTNILEDLSAAQGVHLLAIPASCPNSVKMRVAGSGTYYARLDVEQQGEADLAGLARVVRDLKPCALILSDYGKGCFLGPHVAAIRELLEASCPVIADYKPPQAKRFRGATAVTPNQREAAVITKSAEADPDKLRREMRCGLAVITQGAAGASYATADGMGSVPGAPGGPWIVGAGDAFTAHLALALGSGMKAAEAVAYANAEAAAYTCRPQGHSELL